MFSPIPINRIGICNSFAIEKIIPPLAVPSTFVIVIPEILIVLRNCFAWDNAFCPVVEPKISIVSWGAVSSIFF